jgi:HlyD family secretion protein
VKKAVKYGAIIIAVAAVSGGIAVAVTQPPAVECIELEITMLENTFNEMGEIIPLSETDIYTKTGGRLLAFSLSEGAAVQEGDKLFTFDGSDLQSEAESMAGEISVVDSQIKNTIVSLEMQKNSLESDKEALRIQAENAQMEEKKLGKDLQTVQLLHDFGDIPAQDLDNIRFAYELAVKNRELAAASLNYVDVQILALSTQINDLRQGLNLGTEKAENQRQQLLAQKAALEARLNLLYEKQSETEIFSPQEGIVRDITVKAGQILTPGTRLCSVYRLHQYRVECYILVENIAGILVGDEVEVTLQLRDEDKIFTGSIVQLAHDAADIVSKVGLSEKRLKVEIAVDVKIFSMYIC